MVVKSPVIEQKRKRILEMKPEGNIPLLKRFCDDEEVMKEIIERQDTNERFNPFLYASDRLRGTKAVVLAAVRKHPKSFEHASPDMQGDKEVLIAACRINTVAMQWASENLKTDREVFLNPNLNIGSDPVLSYAVGHNILDDREVVLRAVTACARNLEYASATLKDDDEVVRAAFKKAGSSLEHASSRLRGDREYIRELALKVNAEALRYANEDIRSDKKFVKELLEASKPPQVVMLMKHYISDELRGDAGILETALQKDKECLKHATWWDKDFVLNAIRNYQTPLSSVAEECLRKDPDIVFAALKNDANQLEHAAKETKQDREIVLFAVRQEGGCLRFADKSMRLDYEVVMEAAKNDKQVFGMLQDKDFRKRVRTDIEAWHAENKRIDSNEKS